jgi:hypothetical protein
MKTTKILLSTLGAAALAFTFSGCPSGGTNVTVNVNKSNTVVVNNASPAAAKTAAPASSPASTPAANKNSSAATSETSGETQTVSGELQKGNAESVILYVGMETGDYAAYCFDNNTDDGRKILEACGNKMQCEVTAEISEGSCKVPGLEADLSDSGRIKKVVSVKTLGKKK